MTLSYAVVICSYDAGRIDNLEEAIQSVRDQSCSNPVEVVVCVDGNVGLYRLLAHRYRNQSGVRVIGTGKEHPVGLAEARNFAIRSCHQDVLCFLDDDAIADSKWVSELNGSFLRHGCPMVVGKIVPLWQANPPAWLTPDFYWLVGGTGSILEERELDVRNGFGSNLSCLREVFVRVGLFEPLLGARGRTILQAEDAELGLRVRTIVGKSPVYNPRAVVFHRVEPHRLGIGYLLRRAYLQGRSKGMMYLLHRHDPSSLDREYSYAGRLVFNAVQTLGALISGRNIRSYASKLFFALSMTSAVVLGFAVQLGSRDFANKGLSKSDARAIQGPSYLLKRKDPSRQGLEQNASRGRSRF